MDVEDPLIQKILKLLPGIRKLLYEAIALIDGFLDYVGEQKQLKEEAQTPIVTGETDTENENILDID